MPCARRIPLSAMMRPSTMGSLFGPFKTSQRALTHWRNALLTVRRKAGLRMSCQFIRWHCQLALSSGVVKYRVANQQKCPKLPPKLLPPLFGDVRPASDVVEMSRIGRSAYMTPVFWWGGRESAGYSAGAMRTPSPKRCASSSCIPLISRFEK